jgi:hypothetical protein
MALQADFWYFMGSVGCIGFGAYLKLVSSEKRGPASALAPFEITKKNVKKKRKQKRKPRKNKPRKRRPKVSMEHQREFPRRRPITVTILAILVLIIATTNLIRFWAAIQNWETLVSIGVTRHISHNWAGLGLTGCWLVWVVWQGRPGCKKAIIVFSGLYLLYFWLDRLVFQNHIPLQNTPFIAGIGILVVFYMVFTLLLPSNQEFFSREYEQ